MTNPDRRTFLKTAGAGIATATAAAALAERPARGEPSSEPSKPRKAFMLGVSEGPILPHFERLRDAGFDGVELLSPNKLDRDEVLRAREKTGIVIHGVSGSRHWDSPLSDPDPAVVERGLEAIRKSIADCAAYGGTTVLLVPAVVTKKVSYKEAFARSQANIRKILPDAEKHGIKIAIEEVWNRFLLSAPEFARFVDSFESKSVGAYFDVGNVVEYGYPEQWVRDLGSRILKVHIKEYAKAKRFDYRLGEGEIDWKGVRQAFAEIGYHGWFTAEVGYGDVASLKDVVKRMNDLLGLG